MRIGIVGSDDRAKAIGRLLRGGGHQLSIADPTATQRAERVAAEIGARPQTPYKQAMQSELLVMAVPRAAVDTAVKAVGSGAQAVVVDAVGDEYGNGAHSGAEMLAAKLNSHRVVRALINMPQSGANVPICGDDPNAKAMVDRALRSSGCMTTDRGPLANAAELEVPAAVAA
jgi:predicted dinucleotide-binding enzyme